MIVLAHVNTGRDRGGKRQGNILVESDGIIRQTQVSEDQEASEERAQRDHLQEGQAHGNEEVERSAGGQEEGQGRAGEMPHREADLHVLELGVAEDPIEGKEELAIVISQIVFSFSLIEDDIGRGLLGAEVHCAVEGVAGKFQGIKLVR